ncbi:20621_t:CDS:2, partial [Dentiscutata erythropus]
KKILNNHEYWEQLNEHLEFQGPNSHATKYKTHKSIFVKNRFVCDNLFNLYNISKNNNVCSLCDTEYFLIEKCRNLIGEIREEKRLIGYEFCRFVE